MQKYILFFILTYILPLNLLQAQYTIIPDVNFEQALIDLAIDNQIDGRVLTGNINTLTSLTITNKNISDLTGIQDFVSLITLNCAYNNLSSINISNNAELTFLNCSANNLTNIDVSNNVLLANFFCASNQLTNINVSANDSLVFFDCSNNQLTNIDVSNKLALTNLTCSSNQLGSLNISTNDALSFLNCANNQLISLNINNNIALLNLISSSNQISNIDFSNNTAIQTIDIASNLINSLDFSNDTSITSINCSNNQLVSLNIQNGKNDIITSFNASSNPYLRCIIVDDPASANNYNNWTKDNIATYNTTCNPYTYVPDDNFEAALASYDDIAGDDYVPTANIESLISLDISGQSIADLTGIKDFVALETLNCSQNSIINLNTGNLASLTTLNCSNNSLEALILNNNTNLTTLDATNNPLLTCIQVDDVAAANAEANWTKDAIASYNLNCNGSKTYVPDDNFEQALIKLGYDHGGLDDYVITDSINTVSNLDISGKNISNLTGIEDFIGLDTLNCSSNNLQSLDITTNINLTELSCVGNYLTNLDVSNNVLLTKLFCGNNNLNNIDVSANIALQQIICDANQLATLNISNNVDLQVLNCNSNYITGSDLDLSTNIKLEKIFCANNKLNSIDVTNNVLLTVLDCANNQIGLLDLSNNYDLIRLDCSLNELSSLNLTNDTVLENINCNSNQIQALNFVKNPLLRKISCNDNILDSINISTNDSLRELSASNNLLSQVSTQNLIFLNTLNLASNKIDSLNFSGNDSLKILSCENNILNYLNLEQNFVLEKLNCENSKLSSLNINTNTQLTELNCSKNNIDSIIVATNVLLRQLYINNNQLSELDISNNDSLREINCSGNNIVTLDFSSNTYLNALTCSSNQLSGLNVQNGNNAILETFYTRNNPNLTCIEVDDVSNIGTAWEKDATASYAVNCHHMETYVPDDNFEAALSVLIGETTNNNDNYVLTSDIENLASLDISNKNITDLTGIDDFSALTSFNVSGNTLDSLNVNKNINLVSLNCSNTQIDSLFLAYNTALEILDISSNQFTQIDLSTNILLKTFNFSSNQFAEINLNNNTALESLNLSSNQFTGIDISNLTSLTNLICNNNELISLDLSDKASLASLNCASNKLTALNVKNGNNINLTVFDATGNPDLYCIEVDNPTGANNGSGVYASWQTDAGASFSENCHYNQTYVPDDAFEQALKDLGYDSSGTDPLDDYVPTNKINTLVYLSITNKDISDLTGIEDFIGLVTLNCSSNILTSLNIGNNLALEYLICSDNQLSSLETSLNTALKKLEISNNLLVDIDLSNNTLLEKLFCSSNQLTSLNIVNDTALTTVNCSFNQLVTVDANNGYNYKLLNFDLRNNPDLRCILVDDIDLAATYPYWFKDISAAYKLICDDDDNDGVADVDDQCPNTPYGDLVDVFGCSIFMLPTDNFTIYVRGETCRTNNNGLVNISATEILNYTATLIGNEDTISHIFTDKLEIRNLRAGTYELCVTVEGKPDYLQCYSVVITEPEDLGVELELNKLDNSVSLKMSGANTYIINLNNTIFNTQESEIKLYLEKAENIISVKTNSECQGVFIETIFLADKYIVYPNPFNDYLNLFIGNNIIENLNIEIYSNSGQLLWSNQYFNKSGIIKINTTNFNMGIYYLHLKTETNKSSFKIIKE